MSLAATSAEAIALYPPSVAAPAEPLGPLTFLVRFVNNPLLTVPRGVYEQPAYIVRRPSHPDLVWVTDPSLVERVLLHEHEDFPKTPLEARLFEPTLGHGILTSEGTQWRWQRRTVAPLFRHQELLGHLATMTGAAEEVLERWRRTDGRKMERVDRDMTDATYSVITRTLLAGTTPREDAVIKRAASTLLGWTSWEVAFALLGLSPAVWHPGKRPSRRAAARLRGTVAGLLARRRAEIVAGGAPPSDLLARLLTARDPDNGAPMSDEQLIDNLLTFLLAGHETTAKALTWALYLAARSPAWQDRVRAEVSTVCGSLPIEGRHIEELPLTHAFIQEAMRLYPPVPVMTRMAGRELEINGRRIGKGALVMIPVFAVHRHRRLWQDPDRFDPERFFPESASRQLRTQFMPFGFGPRTCIGMAFAMLEVTAIFATLIRGARFDWNGRHYPEPVSRVTLRPRGGMPLLVSPFG